MKVTQAIEGKRVKLTYTDGEVLTGIVLDYIRPEDNEPEGMWGLNIKCDQRDYLLGVNQNELKSVEVIE